MVAAGGLEFSPLALQRAQAGGTAGARWLRELPGVLEALSERWSLQLGRSFRSGSAAYVMAARHPTGSDLVLKVAMRSTTTRSSPTGAASSCTVWRAGAAAPG